MDTPRNSPPVAVRVVRPFATEDELVAAESNAFTRTGVMLLGAPSRPSGVVLRFEICLRDGTPAMRGEGRVVGYRAPEAGEDGALMLRFTRLDVKSKQLLDRAVALREERRSLPPPGARPAAPEATSARPPPPPSQRPAVQPSHRPLPPPPPSSRSSAPRPTPSARPPLPTPHVASPPPPSVRPAFPASAASAPPVRPRTVPPPLPSRPPSSAPSTDRAQYSAPPVTTEEHVEPLPDPFAAAPIAAVAPVAPPHEAAADDAHDDDVDEITMDVDVRELAPVADDADLTVQTPPVVVSEPAAEEAPVADVADTALDVPRMDPPPSHVEAVTHEHGPKEKAPIPSPSPGRVPAPHPQPPPTQAPPQRPHEHIPPQRTPPEHVPPPTPSPTMPRRASNVEFRMSIEPEQRNSALDRLRERAKKVAKDA